MTSSDFCLPRGMWHQEKWSELIERQGALKTRKLFTQFVPGYHGNRIQGFQVLRGRITTLQAPLQLSAAVEAMIQAVELLGGNKGASWM